MFDADQTARADEPGRPRASENQTSERLLSRADALAPLGRPRRRAPSLPRSRQGQRPVGRSRVARARPHGARSRRREGSARRYDRTTEALQGWRARSRGTLDLGAYESPGRQYRRRAPSRRELGATLAELAASGRCQALVETGRVARPSPEASPPAGGAEDGGSVNDALGRGSSQLPAAQPARKTRATASWPMLACADVSHVVPESAGFSRETAGFHAGARLSERAALPDRARSSEGSLAHRRRWSRS